MRALDMAEALDDRLIRHNDAGTEHDEGADLHILPDDGIGAEIDRAGVRERGAVLQRRAAHARLQQSLGLGEFGAAVEAEQFVLAAVHHRAGEFGFARQADEIGKVVFALGVLVRHLRQEAP